MIVSTPPGADILNANATATTAGIMTIPAGRWFTGSVELSASINLAATATPRVTFTTTDATAGPANGSILARLSITGLALTQATDSCENEIFLYGGDTGGTTLDFNAGGASSASCVINGFLI